MRDFSLSKMEGHRASIFMQHFQIHMSIYIYKLLKINPFIL